MVKEKSISINKNIKKSIFKMIKFLLSFALVIGVGYIILNYVPFIAKYDNYIIVSDSMEPVIDVGDVVIIDHSISIEEFEEGQIIAFNADINGDFEDEVIVHYLYSITVVEGNRVYKTKSEVSDIADPWELNDNDILGVHVKTIPNIGSFLRFAQSTVGRIVLVFDVIIIYVLIEFIFNDKGKKKSKVVKMIDTNEEPVK